MTAIKLRAVIWLLLAVAIAVTCGIQFTQRPRLETNLLALLPATERNPAAERAVASLSDAAGNRMIFLVGHQSSDVAKTAAASFATQLRASPAYTRVQAEIPPIDLSQLTGPYQRHRYSLLSDADRLALSSGDPALAERLQRKLYSPFRFGLTLPLADDPFGFTDAWLSGLPFNALKLQPEDGWLTAHGDNKVWIFLSAELQGSAYDSSVQHDAVQAIDNAITAVHQKFLDVEVLRTGTVLYAEAARTSAEHEVDRIGTGSLIGMLILLYLVFRSLRPLALGLLSVAFGIGAAVAVTIAMHGSLHLITLVFGASLIGEAIDYAVQYFAAHLGAGATWEPMPGLRRIAPGLTIALATSLVGYGALMLAPFPALSQIALFAMVGLSAAWLSVFLLLPALLSAPSRRDPQAAVAIPQRMLLWWQSHMSKRSCLILACVLALLSAPGWLKLHGNDDVRLLISRPPPLVEQERQIRELTGFGNSAFFFLIEGDTSDEVLLHEEALTQRLKALIAKNDISGYQALSDFVPSLTRQSQNYALWRDKVFNDQHSLTALFEQAGLRDDIAAQQFAAFTAMQDHPLTLDEWLQAQLSAPFRHLWLGKTEHGYAAIVLPQGVADTAQLAQAADGLVGITPVDKPGSVTKLFHEYRRWGALWVLCALGLVYVVMCTRYGWRQAGLMLLPTVLAMMVALALFGYLGVEMTLFNLMALMLVLGVGVNYSIFIREGGVRAAATLAGVLLSAGTTLLSFGLLAFSSMPALSSFGLTLLTGISIAVLLAPMALSFQKSAT